MVSAPRPLQPTPFDVVEATRRVWSEQWDDESASGVAIFVSLLRSVDLLRTEVDRVMKRHELTFARYEVLTWLATDPDSALTLSWISKTLRIPPATVTNIIDRLELDRLARREPHPGDARTTLAVITPHGRRVAKRATEDLNTEVYRPIGLSEPQRRQLTDLLAQLRAGGGEDDVPGPPEVVTELKAKRRKRAT